MSITAMKQMLEALESYYGYMEPLTTVFGGPRVPAEQSTTGKVEKAITAGRQAIEQAEKQVVFKIYKPTPPRLAIPNVNDAELPWVYDQDPSSGNVASMWVTPVKATPQPQREWVGLTDEEIQTIVNKVASEYQTSDTFARAIEAKLKEKNT